jgi:hypothetical protein
LTTDEFAVVRATAEAAFWTGRQQLDRGELEAALVSLDQARVNDPDNRQDIKEALDETIQRIQALPPAPTRTPVPASMSVAAGTPVPVARPTPIPTPDASSLPSTPAGFAVWADSQGRFVLAAPADWRIRGAPNAEFGSGVVGFRDPSGQAEIIVAVDSDTQAVSPELYAARMDIAMQGIRGYASEGIEFGIIARSPSLRRNFSVTQRDSTGREVTLRGFQVAVLNGKTPYILAASAPAVQYKQFERTFEQIVSTFSFR